MPAQGGRWNLRDALQEDKSTVVLLTINGLKAKGLLDTGADRTIVSEAVAKIRGRVSGYTGLAANNTREDGWSVKCWWKVN